MNRVFFRTLADILDAGGSADLLTILAGEREGRALTAQKALVTADGLVPYDEGLRGLWEELTAALPGGDRPLSAERAASAHHLRRRAHREASGGDRFPARL